MLSTEVLIVSPVLAAKVATVTNQTSVFCPCGSDRVSCCQTSWATINEQQNQFYFITIATMVASQEAPDRPVFAEDHETSNHLETTEEQIEIAPEASEKESGVKQDKDADDGADGIGKQLLTVDPVGSEAASSEKEIPQKYRPPSYSCVKQDSFKEKAAKEAAKSSASPGATAMSNTMRVAETYALSSSDKTNAVRSNDQEDEEVAGAYAVQSPNPTTGRLLTNTAPTQQPGESDIEEGGSALVEAELIEDTSGQNQHDIVLAEEVKRSKGKRCRIVFFGGGMMVIIVLLVTVIFMFESKANQDDEPVQDSNLDDMGDGTSVGIPMEEEDEAEADLWNNSTLLMNSTVAIGDQDEAAEEEDICFQSSDELYAALDVYFEDINRTLPEIGSWCVSKVSMFMHLFQPSRAGGHLSEEANLRNVNFHEDIGDWDMSSAIDLEETFREIQNLTSSLGIDRWDTSNIVSLKATFMGAQWKEPLLNLSSWNTTNVESLDQFLRWSNAESPGIGSWDVRNVLTLHRMADGADKFNEDISAWNTQSLTHLGWTFTKAHSFNQNISSWNTSSVRTMQGTFNKASSFDQDLSSWDVSKVETMMQAFAESAFNSDVSGWNVSSVTDLRWAFSGAANFKQDLCAWGTLLPSNADVTEMFAGTACPNTSDPVLPDGPFCFNCN